MVVSLPADTEVLDVLLEITIGATDHTAFEAYAVQTFHFFDAVIETGDQPV